MLSSTSRSCGARSDELRVTGSRTATSRSARDTARPSLQLTKRERRFSAIVPPRIHHRRAGAGRNQDHDRIERVDVADHVGLVGVALDAARC